MAALGATVIEPEGFAEHGPFDVILELVGAINLSDNLKALDTGGRIAVIGTGAGAKGEINLGLLMMKRARIHGSTLRARPLEEKALTARAIERSVLPAAGGRRRRACRSPRPSRWTRAEDAYERFQAGGKLGKIVLELLATGLGSTPMEPGGDAAWIAPLVSRWMDRLATAGDLEQSFVGELRGDGARLVHQRPELLARDRPRGVRGTDRFARSALAEQLENRRAHLSVRADRGLASVRRKVGPPLAEHPESGPELALGATPRPAHRRCWARTGPRSPG